MDEKDKLIRLSYSKESGFAVLGDSLSYRDGRSAYVHKCKECYERALKRKGFENSLKKRVKNIPREIIEQIGAYTC